MSEIEKFTTDSRELAALIRCGKDKVAMKELVENDEKFKHMDLLTANIANDVTNAKLKYTVNEKGDVNMCAAIAEMRRDSRLEGRVEGRLESRLEGIKEGEARAAKKYEAQLTELADLKAEIARLKALLA